MGGDRIQKFYSSRTKVHFFVTEFTVISDKKGAKAGARSFNRQVRTMSVPTASLGFQDCSKLRTPFEAIFMSLIVPPFYHVIIERVSDILLACLFSCN